MQTRQTHLLLAVVMVALPRVAAAQWSAVGATQRPSWVKAGVERRLRLLAALPAVRATLSSASHGYFGARGPGVVFGLVLDTGLYYSQGFGFADAAKTCQPDELTIYRPGSLSKVMTGTGLMTLVDDSTQNVSLGDLADEQRYLPELRSVCPQLNQPCDRGQQRLGIRLRHLVSHTSGLADVLEQNNAEHDQWISDLKRSWLRFAPGSASGYSGVGVEGVGLILHRITGKSYVDVIRDNLFVPLGMKDSSMDHRTLPSARQATMWSLSIGSSTWSFSPVGANLGDDDTMLVPAGGLATNVRDLSAFLQMWLSGVAPQRNGHPILGTGTLQHAGDPQITSPGAGVSAPGCSASSITDSHNFFYRECAPANGFGVNWFVGTRPYIQHDGDDGVSGSNTVVDIGAKMAVTGLVSTAPAPNNGTAALPPGLDGGFIYTNTWALLNAALAGDAATTWDHQPLAMGVARLLFLSGKTPSASDLDGLSASFIAEHHLDAQRVVSFLSDFQRQHGRCATFRVRDVKGARELTVRLECDKDNVDLDLVVEATAPFKISWSAPPSNVCAAQGSAPPPPPARTCLGHKAPGNYECRCGGNPPFCTTPIACAHACGGNRPRGPRTTGSPAF